MQTETDPSIRKSIQHNGSEREYFVMLPKDYDPGKVYWGLVAAHGGGGNGRTFWMIERFRSLADELGLEAIVISPSFDLTDPPEESFPVLGGIAFLDAVVEDARLAYRLQPKILVTGYSRGGQFSHRYALWNPGKVEACAPLSAGSWTTPDGRLLITPTGEIKAPESFLLSSSNAKEVSKTHQYLFDSRIAEVAGTPAKADANQIPFLVMCGSLDEQFENAQQFVESLRSKDFQVESTWPRTPHGSRNDEEFRTEFEKYPRGTIEFFMKVTG